MIEQINIILSKKGSGISQPGSLKPAVGDFNVRKRHIHQDTKSDRMNIPRSSLRTGQYCKIQQLRGHCNGGLQFYTFLTVTDCVLKTMQTKLVE